MHGAAAGADATGTEEVTSGLQHAPSYDLTVTAGTAAAATHVSHARPGNSHAIKKDAARQAAAALKPAAATHARHARTGSISGHATKKDAARQAAAALKPAAKQAQRGRAKKQRKAAQPQHQPCAQAQPKTRKTFLVGGSLAPALAS